MNDLVPGNRLAPPGSATHEAPLLALRRASYAPPRGIAEGRIVAAVHELDLSVAAGRIVGILGAAGAGKSTLARLAVGLLPLSSGERLWRGRVLPAGHSAPLDVRRRMQMLFQDAHPLAAALNGHRRVVDIVGEAPRVQRMISPKQQVEYVALQLNRVGIDPMVMRRFPHEFSAGERVRIALARALAVRPELVVYDDPLAHLDVAARAQLINVFLDVRTALDLTYVFIGQDPKVVAHVSDRMAVMHRGRIVEWGRPGQLVGDPAHPYTRALMAAMGGAVGTTAGAGRARADRATFPRADGPSGCAFRGQCPHALPVCGEHVPVLVNIGVNHAVACHLQSPVATLGSGQAA
ncbi:MAG: oligopeptide/dipeptide ABC transporter ATP-binding protein [Casimicrobiaceae bacterium]